MKILMEASMSKVATHFMPEEHGYRFLNSFQLHFPIQYSLPFGGKIDLNDVVYGLCGGMCFSALDYFFAGQPHPDATSADDVGKDLFVYLCSRQLDSLAISTVLKVAEWMLLEDASLQARMTRTEIPGIKRSLDNGKPCVLCLIRVHGLANPARNHQVIATGYEYEASTKQLTLSLYDPNHPGETTCILVSRGSSGFQASESTGETLRGFFLIPYQPGTLPKLADKPQAREDIAAQVSFDAQAASTGFHLQWPVDSHRVNQYFGEHPENYKGFGLPGHEGLDLFAVDGATVYAAADGQVYQANAPAGHPYGLHIRIRHDFGGRTYHTIYGHLEQVFVSPGQTVSAGDRIGLADNTGNSFGSHLHLTLKIDGEHTPGYPAGVVDPWPYLKGSVPVPTPKPLPASSGVTVYTIQQVNMRVAADVSADLVTILPAGEALTVLGDHDTVVQSIGQNGQWMQVKTASGQDGFVAAWYVQTADRQPFPPSDLVVYPFDSVNLRDGPGTAYNVLAGLTMTDPLTVLGDANAARSRLGQQNAWIQVQAENGSRGFVAAWLVHVTGQIAPSSGVTVFPLDFVNVRARATTDANILTVARQGDALSVLGDRTQEMAKIGQQSQWLNVQTAGSLTGYVAAWLVQAGKTVQPVPGGTTGQIYPTSDINLRAQASVNSPRVGGAYHNDPLVIMDTDISEAKSRIGQQDQWIYVQAKDGTRGWAAAWLVSTSPS
jgi:murein DD-endopeptidase MepM/ murein hydrolase activator NlpD